MNAVIAHFELAAVITTSGEPHPFWKIMLFFNKGLLETTPWNQYFLALYKFFQSIIFFIFIN